MGRVTYTVRRVRSDEWAEFKAWRFYERNGGAATGETDPAAKDAGHVLEEMRHRAFREG